jgi:hypothetical protein
MNSVKYKAVYWFFTHIFLRRIGKRYPDWFKKWIYDTTDKPLERKIMMARYAQETQPKFEAIACDLRISPRRVFTHHKNAVDRLIS